MGQRLFQRTFELKAGTRGLSNLDISFNVVANLKREPNTGTITVYNLAPATRLLLEQDEDLRVELKAGYAGDNHTIFLGDVESVTTTRQGADVATEFECGDGERAHREARTQRSYRKGAAQKNIVNDLIEDLKAQGASIVGALGSGNLDDIAGSLAGSRSIYGRTEQALSEILGDAGFEHSVQQGRVSILRKGRGLRGQAIRLAGDSGLLDTPQRDSKGIVSARCIMVPGLFPGARVVFDGLSGVYVVDRATYSGDTRGDLWDTALQCKPEVP